MQVVSKNFKEEKKAVVQTIKVLFYIACVLFFYIAIPWYVFYQAIYIENKPEFRRLLWINIVSFIFYILPFVIFMFKVGLTTGPAYGRPELLAGYILLLYPLLHLVILYIATKIQITRLLQVLVLLPGAVLVLVWLLVTHQLVN